MTSFVRAVILALPLSLHVSCALPDRAGSCEAGPAVLAGTAHGQTGNGVISDGGYKLSVNDVQVPHNDDQVPFNLYTGDTNKIKIETGSGANDETFFRGFLIRVSGVTSGLPANGTLTLTDEDRANAQILPNKEPPNFPGADSSCDLDVAGMCHTANGDKEEVKGNLQFETVGNYLIEVTIVKTNTQSEGRDNWYYSKFYAEVENPPPSVLPSSMPSDSPSASPMPSATPQPSPAPVPPPVEAPSPTSGGVILLVASSALSGGLALCFTLLGF